MPKEQGHFAERPARGTSKTAKDKSNSATLRASQGGSHRDKSGKGDLSNRMLRCDSEKDSEKDSGYSEAGSESVHTDLDDQRSSVSEPHRESSKSSNNKNSGNAAGHNMPPYEELTPIYVIKNLVVKQSRPEQLLPGPLTWGGGWHSLTNAKAPTQLLLIQQPAMPTTTSYPQSPLSSQAAPQGQVKKGGSRSNQNHSSKNHSSKNSYLPILNSYPRIAPHPRKESHEGKSAIWLEGVKESGSEGQSQSKRVCTEEEKREAVSTSSHIMKSQQQHQKEGRVHSHSHKSRGHSSFPSSPPNHASSTTQHKSHHCHQSSASDSVGSPSVSSSQTPSPPSSSNSPSSSSPPSSSPSSSMSHSPYCLAPDSSSTRHRRFLNTAEILNQSGLLAITLRTKELLKQNAATEREISQLRQHTHLLCQAAQASQNGCNEGSDTLEKLLHTMTESGSYPNLNHLKVFSRSHQQSKAGSEEDREEDTDVRTTKTHSNPPQVVSLHNIDDGTSPPSPLFAPSPDTGDDPLDPLSASLVSFSRSVPEQAVTENPLCDPTKLPESSTYNDYLL